VDGLFVVLLFTLPLLIGLAVLAVKLLEVALNRDIASARVVAIKTTFVVFGITLVGVAAGLIYVFMLVSGDRS
jgi:hypothetical protein